MARAISQLDAPRSLRMRNGIIWIAVLLMIACAALYLFSLFG
jgi:hypothetical protein